MKLLHKGLLTAAGLLILTACSGSDDLKPSITEEDENVISVSVPDNGTLSYTGSGAFEGFSLNGSFDADTIYIKKTEADYAVKGYNAVSDRYVVSFNSNFDTQTNTFADAEVSIPYSEEMFQNEGGSYSRLGIAGILNGSPVPYHSERNGNTLTAEADIPMEFFAGYRMERVSIPEKSIISLGYEGYASAGESLYDGAGNITPDRYRGISSVQAGEKVVLNIMDSSYTLQDWELVSYPENSYTEMVLSGDSCSFIPTSQGLYTIRLTAVDAAGDVYSEDKRIHALSYSYAKHSGDSFCYGQCHDGTLNVDDFGDDFGRQTLRNLADTVEASAHGQAYAAVAGSDDPECYRCHTTGFFFVDRNADALDDHPNTYGHDDLIADWSEPDNTTHTHTRGVTCEACHGPAFTYETDIEGSAELTHEPEVSPGSGACLVCHDTGNEVQGHFFEYSDSHDKAHLAEGSAQNDSCIECHTSQGFKAGIYGTDIAPSDIEQPKGVSCDTCHDPHGESDNPHQLLAYGSTSVAGETVDAGASALCYECHRATEETLPAVGNIVHNSQAEMYEGTGGYEYGDDLGNLRSFHKKSGTTCTDCHMKRLEGTTHASFSDDYEGRADYCNDVCHSIIVDEITADGYIDYAGQTDMLNSKMAELKVAINTEAGLSTDTAVKGDYAAEGVEGGTLLSLNRAAYNYNFIKNDRSGGNHNFDYAVKLIELSLADLKGAE
ncbi:multiheme c-type cytochrome [Limisalsivibrio acetivorans]|uniref:multiheme c-type cytochrome n=1 Tax=Limisalsivibrio acetivorans TaxID=1304888 RepID=UPI0003B5226F|nr:cytochrome c3 family protein [Limisalsivibrio acetivorans]